MAAHLPHELLSLDLVAEAGRRLDGIAHRTPLLTSRTLNASLHAHVWLKAEHLQRTGSFKFRGAYNAVAALSPSERERGLCTVSSGNHAQALALAGRLHDTAVTVHMPHDAPAVKVRAARSYGAKVVEFNRFATPQTDLVAELRREDARTYISAHDDLQVAAGAATAALELFEELGPVDILVAPVGGGGGLSGFGTVARAMAPACRVIGVEPAASGVNRLSLGAGRPLAVPVPRTIADGQTLTTPGFITFAIMQEVVDDIVLVSEDEIIAGMVFLFERMKVVAEPSGACGVAALLAGRVAGAGKRIALVLSGGNVDITRFARLVAR